MRSLSGSWSLRIGDFTRHSFFTRHSEKEAVCKPGRGVSSGMELAGTLLLDFQLPES